ncbi:MAG: FAD-dependent monooxygenase [Dermatophilaceae bacterium]
MDLTREVVVIGGGPAGVVTGLLLSDLGVDALVVDKRAELSPLPRARGIHARATEILRQLGIEADMVAAALPIRPRLQVRGPLCDPPTAVVPTGGDEFVEVSPCEGIAIAQDLFEGVLRRHLRRRPGVDLRLGHRATDMHIRDDGTAVVTLQDASGQAYAVHAAYVVAADGWRSDVRSLCGTAFLGEESLATLRGVHFRADLTPWLDDPPPAFVQLTHVPGILLPTHADHRWGTMRFVGPGGAGPDDAAAFVREQLGIDIAVDVLGDTLWSVGVQWADTMRHGPVFLVGDAAHRVTPQGAGGISAAMADAHNLAWKLAATLRGWGGPALLASYAGERGSVTREICAANTAMWLAMTAAEAPSALDLRTLDMGYRYVSDVVAGSEGRPVLDTTTAYAQSADPGMRAPHAWLDEQRTRSSIDAYGRGFVLVCSADDGWPQAVAGCQAELAIPVSSLVTDRADVLTAYRLQAGGAVLVRPDGHVAWRCGGCPDPGAALTSALATAAGHS